MMKKLLFLGLAFSASVGVSNAQKARLNHANLGPKVSADLLLKGDAYTTGNGAATTKQPTNNQKTNIRGTIGTKIGKTFYDLPTNASVANRILRHSDGTVSAVWTETCAGNGAPSFPTRGIGYNYDNGNNWIEGATGNSKEFNGTCGNTGAIYGIASKRVGWPEIISVGGNEMVFTHDVGISVTKRPNKGTGGMNAWSTTTDLAFTQNIDGVSGNNGTWPRVVSSGNNIHMIYAINNTPVPVINGVSGMVVYSRSTDGGVTWDKQNIQLPGLTSANGYTRVGGDSYALAVNGNNVAIIAGYFGQPWTMWKSTDNGNTFTRTVMKALVPADTVGNTFSDGTIVAYSNDNGHAAVIDNNGNVHAFAGELLIQVKDTLGTVLPGNSYYPNAGQALYYWTDKTPTLAPVVIAEIEPANALSNRPNWIANGAQGGGANGGRQPYGVLGMVSMANAAYDAAGNIYVMYAAAVRGTSHLSGDSTGQPYRDLYFTKYNATQNAWAATPTNIGRTLSTYADKSSPAENGEENVFPSVSHFVDTDGLLHATWMSDFLPGMNLGADGDPEGENSIMYVALNTGNLAATGIKEAAAFVNNINAYPNPTNGKIAINVDLKKSANVKVRITNIMGQEVKTVEAGKLATGNNTVSVDMSNFANGIYLYTVSSDNFTVTNRIVKQ